MRKGDYLTTFIVPKVMKISKGLFRPVAGKVYLLLWIIAGMAVGRSGRRRWARPSRVSELLED